MATAREGLAEISARRSNDGYRNWCRTARIRGCIFGENWSKADEATWRVLRDRPELKKDSDLGRGNQGITVILL